MLNCVKILKYLVIISGSALILLIFLQNAADSDTSDFLQSTKTSQLTTILKTVTSKPQRYRMVDDSERTKRKDNLIFVLFWNKFQGFDETWGLPKNMSSQEALKSANCPHTNCIFTFQKNMLPQIHDFDVLIMTSWWEIHLEVPQTRHPSQFYVLGNNEFVDCDSNER